MSKILYQIALLITLLAGTTAAYAEDTLDQIKASGKLKVGIRTDTKPFGFINEKREKVGFEDDLVADLANRLQVKLGRPIEVAKIVVIPKDRMEFLQHGVIDLLIASLIDTPERRKVIDIIDPDYFTSGVNLLTLKTNHVTKWEDIKGKFVCTVQGAWYNNPFHAKYGFVIAEYESRSGATAATLEDHCIGFLDDDAHAIGIIVDPKMREVLELPLETQSYAPWGVAMRKGNPLFHAFVAEAIADWHRTGLIIELEKRYGIPPSGWAQHMHEKYAAKQQ